MHYLVEHPSWEETDCFMYVNTKQRILVLFEVWFFFFSEFPYPGVLLILIVFVLCFFFFSLFILQHVIWHVKHIKWSQNCYLLQIKLKKRAAPGHPKAMNWVFMGGWFYFKSLLFIIIAPTTHFFSEGLRPEYRQLWHKLYE